jgi:Ras family
MWDTAGGTATLDRLGPGFWHKAAAFLYVFNVSNVSSFNVLTALRSLLQDQVRYNLGQRCASTLVPFDLAA